MIFRSAELSPTQVRGWKKWSSSYYASVCMSDINYFVVIQKHTPQSGDWYGLFINNYRIGERFPTFESAQQCAYQRLVKQVHDLQASADMLLHNPE